jgi:glycosyltransferase involved in cell wall biosynthesis
MAYGTRLRRVAMSKRKVLYICHNHPTIRPGGTEVAALELYEAMRDSPAFEPFLLARTGPPLARAASHRPGNPFSMVGRDPNQYFVYTDASDFDWFLGTLRHKDFYTRYVHDFLTACQPDIVHFQHTSLLGYDMIRATRNALPTAPIFYTLHEFLPICHREGQMLRTLNQELCREESPRRCHECFQHHAPQDFFLRKRFILSQFALVDLFLAPSRFLIERYVDWGIPGDKIRYHENGRRPAPPTPGNDEQRPRVRLGFFGQITPYKGVDVLLKAMELIGSGLGGRDAHSGDAAVRRGQAPKKADEVTGDAARPHLWLHGANLEGQSQEFQDQVRRLLDETRMTVTFAGPYDREDLGALMAEIDWVVVPSIWWENAPMVIQEAFQHGRPVICSDIGGMAEKVTDGVNGLHFRVGDPASLARTIRRAVTSPGLWETLRRGIPAVYSVEASVATLTTLYETLLDQAMSRVAVAPGSPRGA